MNQPETAPTAAAPPRTRAPTRPETHAKHLRAAGWLCIPPGASLWRRLVLAWRHS